MRPTGVTVLAYKAIRFDLLARLRAGGIDGLRFVSHDQTTFFVDGLKPTPWMQTARELCAQLDARMICTMNERALPKLSYADTAGRYEATSFRAWIDAYVDYMSALGTPLAIDYGNEPDASKSIFVTDEQAFRQRYAVAAASATFSAARDSRALLIGGGGFCQDWVRAREFVRWAEGEGVRLDFLSLHVYGAPARLRLAVETVRQVSDVPIWLIETGCDWQGSNLSMTPDVQREWRRDFAIEAARLGIARWHVMGAWIDPSQSWAAEYNCMMNAAGRLTPIALEAA